MTAHWTINGDKCDDHYDDDESIDSGASRKVCVEINNFQCCDEDSKNFVVLAFLEEFVNWECYADDNTRMEMFKFQEDTIFF